MDKKKKEIEFFTIDKKLISIGSDWNIKRVILGDFKIAIIDSVRGQKIKIEIYDEQFAKKPSFVQILILFAITIPFHDEMKSRINTYCKAIRDATLLFQVSDYTLENYSKSKIKPLIEAPIIEDTQTPSKTSIIEPREDKQEELETYPTEKIPKAKIKKVIKKELTDSSLKTAIEAEKDPFDTDFDLAPPPKFENKKEIESESEKEPVSSNLAFKIEDPIEKSPGIGNKTGARFREIGITTIGEFINANIDELYSKLQISWISKSKLAKWQKICSDNII